MMNATVTFETIVENSFSWFSATTPRKYALLILATLLLASLPACSAERSTAPVVETAPQEKILVVTTDYQPSEYGSAIIVSGSSEFRATPGFGKSVFSDTPLYVSLVGDQQIVIANVIGYALSGDSIRLKESFKTSAGSPLSGIAAMREWVMLGEKVSQFLRDTSYFANSLPTVFRLGSASMQNANVYSSLAIAVGFESRCQNAIIDASELDVSVFQGKYNSSWKVPGARLIKLECYSKDKAPAAVLAGYQRQLSGM